MDTYKMAGSHEEYYHTILKGMITQKVNYYF